MSKHVLVEQATGGKFEMKMQDGHPGKGWDYLGNFLRLSDNQHFIVHGKGIYAGEVDENALSTQLADFMGLGRRIR